MDIWIYGYMDMYIYIYLDICIWYYFFSSVPIPPRPIIVFDGEKLPAKAKEDQRRGQLREAARLRALELLQRKEKGEEVDDREVQQKCQP